MDVNLAPRFLQYNLSMKVDAHLYVAAYTDSLLEANTKLRVLYGWDHKHHTVMNYWHAVSFIDEAHLNLTERFQRKRILKRSKKGLTDSNIRPQKRKKRSNLTLHIYASVNR